MLRIGPSEARAVASASNVKRRFKLLDFVKALDGVAINNLKRKADPFGSKTYYHLSLKCTDFSRVCLISYGSQLFIFWATIPRQA
jgi:hypothetical protein